MWTTQSLIIVLICGDVGHLFMSISTTCMSSLKKCLFAQISCSFSQLGCYLLFDYESSLYPLDMRPLSYIWFTAIFLPSMGWFYFFTFLVTLFKTEKCFNPFYLFLLIAAWHVHFSWVSQGWHHSGQERVVSLGLAFLYPWQLLQPLFSLTQLWPWS